MAIDPAVLRQQRDALGFTEAPPKKRPLRLLPSIRAEGHCRCGKCQTCRNRAWMRRSRDAKRTEACGGCGAIIRPNKTGLCHRCNGTATGKLAKKGRHYVTDGGGI